MHALLPPPGTVSLGRRLAVLLLAIAAGPAAVLAGCSTGDGGAVASDELLTSLEITTPDSIDWRRELLEIEIAGSSTDPDPGELALLEAALGDLDPAFREAAGVRTIYRIPGADTDRIESRTLAFSRGPDVYLTDRTFSFRTGGTTRLEMSRILAHELAHVAQFNALTEEDVEAVVSSGASDPITVSRLVRDFAGAVGWEDRSTDPGRPEWVLAGRAGGGTTEYGRTAPEEDMAEAVSLIAMGRSDDISADRIAWVVDWLGVNPGALTAGKPYIPEGAEEVAAAAPLYDQEAVARYAAAHVEPVYHLLPGDAPPTDALVETVRNGLASRRLAGTLAEHADGQVPRHSGYFTRPDGTGFWVELWDFRDVAGDVPDGPLLVYVALW